jgi:hypothetical protein
VSTTTAPPQLVARFEIDPSGTPVFTERSGQRHYKIIFEVQNPPTGAYAATFELDPSYYDPRRTLAADSAGRFRLETTAYGDYEVKVRLRTKEGDIPLLETVQRALDKSREHMGANPAIDEAIQYIASH